LLLASLPEEKANRTYPFLASDCIHFPAALLFLVERIIITHF